MEFVVLLVDSASAGMGAFLFSRFRPWRWAARGGWRGQTSVSPFDRLATRNRQGGKSHISKSTMAVGVVTTILGVLVVIWPTASIIVAAGGCDVRSAHTVLSPGSAISNSSAKARAARDSASSRMPTW